MKMIYEIYSDKELVGTVECDKNPLSEFLDNIPAHIRIMLYRCERDGYLLSYKEKVSL